MRSCKTFYYLPKIRANTNQRSNTLLIGENSPASCQLQHSEETSPKREFGCNRATEKCFCSPVSQLSSLKNFVPGVNKHWNKLELLLRHWPDWEINFKFYIQWPVGFFFFSGIFNTIALLVATSFLFLSSSFLHSFYLPVKDYHCVPSLESSPWVAGLHNYRRLRYVCTCVLGDQAGCVNLRGSELWGAYEGSALIRITTYCVLYKKRTNDKVVELNLFLRVFDYLLQTQESTHAFLLLFTSSPINLLLETLLSKSLPDGIPSQWVPGLCQPFWLSGKCQQSELQPPNQKKQLQFEHSSPPPSPSHHTLTRTYPRTRTRAHPLLSITHSRHKEHARWRTPARNDPTPFPCVTPPDGPIRGRTWGPGYKKTANESAVESQGLRRVNPSVVHVQPPPRWFMRLFYYL